MPTGRKTSTQTQLISRTSRPTEPPSDVHIGGVGEGGGGGAENFFICFRSFSVRIGGTHRRGSRIQKGGFVQEFWLENRSYPDVHDFSLRMQVIIAND